MEPYQILETRWAEWNQLDPAGMVACASGTAALHLALEALQLPPGSEVIVPDFTMVACPRAVTLAGLTPVFVDCNETLNVDNDLVMYASNELSFGMMYVHVYGRKHRVEDIRIAEMLRGNGYIIEDLAESHGVKPGPFTDAACWSFYRNKIVAGEEGGAVWFRNPKHAALARQLRSLGFTDAHDFNHVPRGHNYRMSNAHARLVLSNLDFYNRNLHRRWANWEALNNVCPAEWRFPRPDAPWVFPLRIPGLDSGETPTATVGASGGEIGVTGGINRAVAALQAVGVAARHGFKPCGLQAEYRGCRRIGGANAERAAREVLYLPLTALAVSAKDCFDTILANVG